jgi:hypothetical protein
MANVKQGSQKVQIFWRRESAPHLVWNKTRKTVSLVGVHTH